MRAAIVQRRPSSGAGVKTMLLATILLVCATLPVSAQDTIQTLPGANTYQLPPGNSQAAPSPTPTPSPTPSAVTPPPVVRTAPSPTPSPTPTRAASPRPTPTPTATPQAPEAPTIPAPAPTTTAIAPAVPTPTSVPSPVPTASVPPTAVETPAAPPAGGPPDWVLWLAGLGLAGGAAFAVLAWRRRTAAAEDMVYTPVPPPPAPPAPAPERAPSVPPKPTIAVPSAMKPAATPAIPARALAFDFRPQRLWTRGPNAYLAFELLLTNASAGPVSGIRPVVTLASAGPDTAAELAGFAAQLSSLPAAEPFDLRAGETRKIAGELTLPGDAMHVTTVAEREMIVPVAMVGAAWRGGLSVASAAEAFVIGAGEPTSAKLGPVWVDRPGQIYGRLDARRFTPR